MILFLNHKTENCGVYQFGKRIGLALQNGKECGTVYHEVENEQEFVHLLSVHNPKVVIYNYYPSTMPWVRLDLLNRHREVVHVAIFHEVPTIIFDYLIHPDPTYIENETNFKIDRLLSDYTNTGAPPETVTVGTFGFGLGGKNYDAVVRKVHEEFDDAIVNVHISYAAFGDAQGTGAKFWADQCRRSITKPGIRLNISHDFLPEDALLDFLAQNTVNAFFYDEMYGRGIASVTDYALAVGRPLAITKSYMFRHIHAVAPEICVENNSLSDIIAMGTTPIDQFKTWSKENLITQVEVIYDSIKNTRSI